MTQFSLSLQTFKPNLHPQGRAAVVQLQMGLHCLSVSSGLLFEERHAAVKEFEDYLVLLKCFHSSMPLLKMLVVSAVMARGTIPPRYVVPSTLVGGS